MRWIGSVAVACGAAVAAAWWVGRAPELTYTTAEAGVGGAPRGVLAARADAELPVAFSDGSRVTLAPGARLTVESLTAAGAALALEAGRADIRVMPGPHARWSLRAGAETLSFSGARLSIAWSPAADELDVEVREGAVMTSGGRALRAGETLRTRPARSAQR